MLGAFHLRRDKKRVQALLEFGLCSCFPVLQDYRRRRSSFLSGGEQQMVSIGRMLMSDPEILLLDEPSDALSPVAVDNVVKALHRAAPPRRLAAAGRAAGRCRDPALRPALHHDPRRDRRRDDARDRPPGGPRHHQQVSRLTAREGVTPWRIDHSLTARPAAFCDRSRRGRRALRLRGSRPLRRRARRDARRPHDPLCARDAPAFRGSAPCGRPGRRHAGAGRRRRQDRDPGPSAVRDRARRRWSGSPTGSAPRSPAPAPSIITAIWWRRSTGCGLALKRAQEDLHLHGIDRERVDPVLEPLQ